MEKNRILIIALVIMLALNLGLSGFMFFRGFGKHHKIHRCEDKIECKRLDEEHEKFKWGEFKKGDRMDFMKDRISKALGFSEEQSKELEVLQNKHFDFMRSNKEKEHKTRENLMTLLVTETVDPVKKDSLIQELAANKIEMSKAFFDHFAEIKELCNEDQKPRFDTLLLEMKNKMKHHRMPE